MNTSRLARGFRASPGRILFWVLPWSGCALVSAAETMLLHWAWDVRGTSSLPALRSFAGITAVNLFVLWLVRRYARRRPAALVLGRAYLLASFGALASGALLALGLAGIAIAAPHLAELPADALSATRLCAGIAALGLGYGCIAWGAIVGPRRIVLERIRLPLPGVGPALAGLRIAHITDLHIGPQFPAERMREIVARVNALEPDLIAITGDLFDFDPRFVESGCRELAALRARHGVYAVLGNHDLYTGAEAVSAGLKQWTGIRLLRDESERVEIGGEPLYLLGIDDPGRGITDRHHSSAALEQLARATPADAARLLLVHRPSFLRQIAALGLPAALAGHTHGGQISLPRPVHHHNFARITASWTRGMWASGATLMYVNRGLGVTTIPIRLNCPREIALIELVPRDGTSLELTLPRPKHV